MRALHFNPNGIHIIEMFADTVDDVTPGIWSDEERPEDAWNEKEKKEDDTAQRRL